MTFNLVTNESKLIFSAAMASNVSMFGPPVVIHCKNENGDIVPWPLRQNTILQPWHRLRYKKDHSPLCRLADLFLVNHFVISQARPYFTPLFKGKLQRPGEPQPTERLLRLLRSVIGMLSVHTRFRLNQLEYFGYVPNFMRRILLEEGIPAPGIIVLPALSYLDVQNILQQHPTKWALQERIQKGEHGAWQCMSSIQVRCGLEFELEKAYLKFQGKIPTNA